MCKLQPWWVLGPSLCPCFRERGPCKRGTWAIPQLVPHAPSQAALLHLADPSAPGSDACAVLWGTAHVGEECLKVPQEPCLAGKQCDGESGFK
jgi:hypothetical protein